MLYSMNMLDIYRAATSVLQPALVTLLSGRARKGKEISERLAERRGVANVVRPVGFLVHIHAASVGEAQSARIIIDHLLQSDTRIHVLITTGTATSARMLENNLPARCIHQFTPLDNPSWVKSFYNHWHPDFTLWMESELWPNMLAEIKKRHIPALLVNARLSDKSFGRWRMFKNSAQELLSTFTAILAQTSQDAERFEKLGASTIITTGNLKFGAKPLPADDQELKNLSSHIGSRPLWLFASTHRGEEIMAARVHQKLKGNVRGLLTVIVPRHPSRHPEIRDELEATGLVVTMRGEQKAPPNANTDIYVADTMGELGLFYRVAPVACIGRSFSLDGGGGHNPIEAAQLHCAVLHGPNVQFQKSIYDEMDAEQAASRITTEGALSAELHKLLTDVGYLESRRRAAYAFTHASENVTDNVMNVIFAAIKDSVA